MIYGYKKDSDNVITDVLLYDSSDDCTADGATECPLNLPLAIGETESDALTAVKSQWVRDKRDQLLAETDWTGLSDVTMSTEMTTYRQALRDITSNENFPDDPLEINWPVNPNFIND